MLRHNYAECAVKKTRKLWRPALTPHPSPCTIPLLGGHFYPGQVVGYKEDEDVFQVVYDDAAQPQASGKQSEVRRQRPAGRASLVAFSVESCD
jgi:hypothetical protein